MTDMQIEQGAREARLVTALTRARRGGLAVSERALFIAGSAFASAGLVLIIIGWVGTSRTVLVAGQIPYVVSGGLLGLALVFLGGFLYFAYWVATLARESRDRGRADREDLARLAAAVEETNRMLHAVMSERSGGNGSGPRRRARSLAGSSEDI